MKTEKYNGWTNYATWKVSLEIFDEISDTWEEVTADDCKEYALAFLEEVNWQEIAEHLNDNA